MSLHRHRLWTFPTHRNYPLICPNPLPKSVAAIQFRRLGWPRSTPNTRLHRQFMSSLSMFKLNSKLYSSPAWLPKASHSYSHAYLSSIHQSVSLFWLQPDNAWYLPYLHVLYSWAKLMMGLVGTASRYITYNLANTCEISNLGDYLCAVLNLHATGLWLWNTNFTQLGCMQAWCMWMFGWNKRWMKGIEAYLQMFLNVRKWLVNPVQDSRKIRSTLRQHYQVAYREHQRRTPVVNQCINRSI